MGRTGLRVALFVLFALLAIAPLNPREEPQRMVAVLVARQKVPAFEALKESEKWFKVVHYLKGDEPRDAVTDFAQVKGQRLARPLAEDQPLKKTDFLTTTNCQPLLLEGSRAVAVRHSPISPNGFILPGCRVDVIVIKKTDEGADAETVLQNLLVLAIDSKFVRHYSSDDATDVTTLAVPKEQVEQFLARTANADVRLIVRSFSDKADPPSKLADLKKPVNEDPLPDR